MHVLRTTIAVLTAPLLLLTANRAAKAQEAKPPKTTTIIKCEEAATGWTSTVYDGKSASYMYDERFKPRPNLSSQELSDHTPQGVAWWKNWDGNPAAGTRSASTAWVIQCGHGIQPCPMRGRCCTQRSSITATHPTHTPTGLYC